MSLPRQLDWLPELADPHRMAPTIGDAVAANIRAERGRRRWRQVDLAERLGWSTTTISDLESGQRRVTADHLAPLCRAFGIDLAKLADGADPADVAALGL